jgi:hypothetical protein
VGGPWVHGGPQAAAAEKLAGARARGRSGGWELAGDRGDPRGGPGVPHRGLQRPVW